MTVAARGLLPRPGLTALLVVLWLLLTSSLEPGSLLLGALFGFTIPLFTRTFWIDRPIVRRPGLVLRLALRVAWDIVVANFAVAWLTLTARADRLRPRFLVIPLELRDPYATTVLANIITLTPGTVSADLDPAQPSLLVHSLDEPDPEQTVARIKARYERPLREIFR